MLQNLDAATKDAGTSLAYPVFGGSATGLGPYDSQTEGTNPTIVRLANGR